MTISWFGQSCFRVEAREGSVLIDPFAKSVGLRPPRLKDDILLISHEHFDHNNREGVTQETLVVDGPGEYERKGIAIQGILSYHDNQQGAERGLNTIYVLRAEDVTLCHLGDIGQGKLTDEQVEAIGDVDVLCVPVGGTYTVGAKEALGIVNQIEPKLIIPMHYRLAGLTIDLEGPDKFFKEVGLTPERVGKLKVSSKTLPIDETKLIMFELS